MQGPDPGSKERELLSTEDAVRLLRSDPALAELVADSYLDADVRDAANRFATSAEFASVLRLIGGVAGRVVVDLGAGNGIASYAFAQSGAERVLAVEPDPSLEIGRGALVKLAADFSNIEVRDGLGERIPATSGSVDVVYARQVLHHLKELPRAMAECHRVLRPGGLLLACREHVADDEAQLRSFLASHPVHHLTGGENAYRLTEYISAISGAGLELRQVLGPLDTLINAFPAYRTQDELDRIPQVALRRRLGPLGAFAGRISGVNNVVRRLADRPVPGRMYTFVAVKPGPPSP